MGKNKKSKSSSSQSGGSSQGGSGGQGGQSSGSGGAPPPAGKTQRPVLERFSEKLVNARRGVEALRDAFSAWALVEMGSREAVETATTWPTPVAEALCEGARDGVSLVNTLASLEKHLLVLVDNNYQPKVVPRATGFKVGDKVTVDDEWMPKHTASGLLKKEELTGMEILVLAAKEASVKTPSGRELVMKLAHLELAEPPESSDAAAE